ISDIRLDEGEGSDSPPGQLLTFARSWELADDPDNADLVIAEVTGSWAARDGNQQSGIHNSAINRREPSESVTNFLEVAMNAVGGNNGNTGSWGDSPPGEQDPVDPGDDQDPPTDPEDPAEPEDPVDPVYISLTISGDVDAPGGSDGQLTGVSVSSSNPALTWTCTWGATTDYSCTAANFP